MDTIAVLTDFSESARNAADMAFYIAASAGANVILVHAFSEPLHFAVSDPSFWPMETEMYRDGDTVLHLEARRMRHAGKLTSDFREPDITALLYHGSLKACLQSVEKQYATDLLVIGEGRKSESRSRYSPSDIDMVQAHSRVPVLLVPESNQVNAAVKNICFVTDLAKTDLRKTGLVKQIAFDMKAHLFIGHVSKPSFNMDAGEEMGLAAFMSNLEHLGFNQHEFQNCYSEDVVTGIEKFCKDKKADILVMIHKKHSSLWAFFHRSITSIIKRRQCIPILLIRE